jgi:competence protein ComEC
MRATLATLAVLMLLASAPAAQTKPGAAPTPSKTAKTFDFYVIDVEGGAATLFVSPSGEAAMIDSGNPGPRDIDRIMAVLTEVGIKELDYLVSTHYHVDHIGGIQELAKRVPIKHYVDHGPSSEEREQIAGFQAAYAELYGKAKHTVVKPGEKLPIAGLDWRIVTAGGKAIKTPLVGAGKPNPACADFKPREANPLDENGQSVGSIISFGKFRMADFGDLLWNREFDFMCPNNLVGTVDLYIVSHHGTDPSGSPAFVHGLQPRVAISQNGTRKGGTLQTAQTLNTSPNFQDHWQMHWSYNAGTEYNPAGLFIANIDEPAVIAAVLTAPPGGGRGGPGGPGGGAPPAAAGGPAPPGAGAPPAVVGTGAPAAGTPPVAAPVEPPAGAAQPPALAGSQPGTAPPAGAPPAGRQGGPGGGRGGPGVPHIGPAFLIKVSAQADGTFTVTNTRNGFSRTYKPR